MSKVIYDFSGENYIVTGASSGMGKQVALDLAAAGARVLAIARNEERLEALKQAYPDNIVVGSADMGDFARIKKAVDSFIIENGKVKGLVHAAGVYEYTPIRGFDKEQGIRMMEVSYWSGMELMHLLTKKKYSLDMASFVLFASSSAKRPPKGSAVYSSVKAAISAMTKALVGEIAGRGQRINTVCPGLVKTPMTNEHQNGELADRHLLGLGEPDDVSSAVLFLLSDNARWITGTDMVIDGGYLTN